MTEPNITSSEISSDPTMTAIRPRQPRGRPKGSESAIKQRTVAKLVQSTPGISLREIEERTGISKTTSQAYLAKWGINKQELDMFVENRVDIVRSKQKQILDALTPDKLEKAAARDLMVGYGILLDKDRLESGQSTQNISNWTMIVNKAQGAVLNDSTACVETKVIENIE